MDEMGEKGLNEGLKHFTKNQLIKIGLKIGLLLSGQSRDEIINRLISEKTEDMTVICEAYKVLDGVSINVLIKEIFQQNTDIGRQIESCRKKNEVVSSLYLSGTINILTQVADFARFEKKKNSSPLVFIGQLKDTMNVTEMKERVKELIISLNNDRPNKLYYEDLMYFPGKQLVKIKLSREIGRRHIRQRPNRSPNEEMIEHDDYPLNTYILEIDFLSNNVKTTFKQKEIDGLHITKKILEILMKEKVELKNVEFLCNPLDTNQTQIINDRITNLQQRLPPDSSVLATLELMKNAKQIGLTIKGLNLEGDLQKLEIKAGEVSQVLNSLNIDNQIFKGARSMDYELELQDDNKRRVRIVQSSVTFTGNFTDDEKNAIQTILKVTE